MNTGKKIYCRVFQAVMKAALPFLPYRDPVLLNGMQEVADALCKEQKKQVVLVTGPNVRRLGLTKPLEELLQTNGITCVVFDETTANPTVANVEKARELYLQNNCQAIIAFGGGSPMDCAKALGARIACPNKPLHKMEGLIKVGKKIPLLIAVPTTAGTGSETTLAAVITDENTHHKYPINDFNLIPDYAVLAPEVTTGLPPQLTATTGMDALTHAMEVYIGRTMTKETKAASVEAIQLILKNLEEAYLNGTNMEARRNMLRASFLAGTAFSKSYVGYVHAVAHSIGGKYGIPHGLANAVLLPHVLRAYGNSVTKRLAELAYLTEIATTQDAEEAAAEKFICKIEEMNRSMQIPEKLEGIKAEDVAELARYADKEANPLYPVPKLWDAEELKQIYNRVI